MEILFSIISNWKEYFFLCSSEHNKGELINRKINYRTFTLIYEHYGELFKKIFNMKRNVVNRNTYNNSSKTCCLIATGTQNSKHAPISTPCRAKFYFVRLDNTASLDVGSDQKIFLAVSWNFVSCDSKKNLTGIQSQIFLEWKCRVQRTFISLCNHYPPMRKWFWIGKN